MYGGELNKAAGYRPCLNWDSAKFQLPCNWRNLIMSRVKGPWDTMSQIGKLLLSEPRQRAYIIIAVKAAVVAKSSISLLETDHETTVYGDFLYRNTSTFIPKMTHFYTNSYLVIQACHNIRNFQRRLRSYLYLLIIRFVKEQTGFRA